ncbi:MAG: response regulator [Deltaproteobacteria bacterium]|nr:response regulator [Deltaproteobacteria bacterium]MBN2670402.1 response regulator [Deltaproteobacteria bacterium]
MQQDDKQSHIEPIGPPGSSYVNNSILIVEPLMKVDILVVDDRRENLFALENLLSSDDLLISTVESGQDALRQVLEKEFALVILDVQMPGMDGYETAELMRSNSRTKHIPIIFVSAVNKDEHHLFRGYDSGGVDYLFKPIEPKILSSKVRVFVDLFKQRKQLERTSEALEQSLAEIKSKDEQLRQKQKLEAIGKLVGGVAHEIRNPLSFMLSHLRRASKNCAHIIDSIDTLDNVTQLNEFKGKFIQIHQGVEIAIDGGNRISKIVQDLSRFARTDRNEKIRPVEVNEVLHKVVNLAKHDIRLHAALVEQYGDLPPILINESKLFQVFLNLLTNAIHSLRNQQEKDNRITIRSWAADDEVYVEVKDTGCGIPRKNLSKIFDPFFTTKDVGEGTGLGLATCFGIVHTHGGKILVESVEHSGSSFVVMLPIVPLSEK